MPNDDDEQNGHTDVKLELLLQQPLAQLARSAMREAYEGRKLANTAADHALALFEPMGGLTRQMASFEIEMKADRADRADLRTSMLSLKKSVDALTGTLAQGEPTLPPMRPESQSSHELLERLDDRVTASFLKKASETPGPLLTGSPPDLAAIAKSAAGQLLLEERARIKAEADAQRLAVLEEADAQRRKDLEDAAKLRKSDAHKLKQKVIAAVAVWVVLGILGVIAAVFIVGAKVVAARELGHDEAVRELRAAGTSSSPIAPPASH
jgi:hypothetical protein